MNIRIVRRPHGEAPEDVRDAWIGLLLPVVLSQSRLVERRTFGVLSGPRSRLALRLKTLFGGGTRRRGYAVNAPVAIDILQDVNPLAAAWWRTNAPQWIKPGLCLFFEEECCVVDNSPVPH
jgi:hypothetical protein